LKISQNDFLEVRITTYVFGCLDEGFILDDAHHLSGRYLFIAVDDPMLFL